MNSTMQTTVPDEDEINLLDILQVVAENARLLIFGPLAVGLIALGWSYTITPTFTATTSFVTPQQQQSAATAMLAQLGSLAGLAGAAAGIRNPADLYVALLNSRTVADRMIDRFNLMELYETDYRESVRKGLAGSSSISAGKDGLISISVEDTDPKRAAAIANAYVEELARITGSLAVTEAQQRRLFFEQELAKAKENLAKAEIALGGAGAGEAMLKFNPAAMGEGIATLKAQVVAKEVQLSSMRGYLTETSPEFRQARQELTALRAQLAKADKPVAMAGDAEYITRYRDFKYYEVLFEQLARQYEIARIDESHDVALIQVVDVAEPPERKSGPRKAKIAVMATLAAGFALVVFVFVRLALKTIKPENAAKLTAVRQALVGMLRR